MAYTNRKNNVFECGGQRFALECGERHLTFRYGEPYFVLECGGQRFALEFGEQHLTFRYGEPHFSFKRSGQRVVPTSAWRIFGKAGR